MTRMSNETGELSRNNFRPKGTVDHIAKFLGSTDVDNELYMYKPVIYDYKGAVLSQNLQRHEDVGFEYVISKQPMQDDRPFAPSHDAKEELREGPVYRTTSDGYHEVLMKILKSKWQDYIKEKGKQETKRYLDSAGKNAVTVGKHMMTVEDKNQTIIK